MTEPLQAAGEEIEAGARAMAQHDGAGYLESARAVLEGALPMIAERLRRA